MFAYFLIMGFNNKELFSQTKSNFSGPTRLTFGSKDSIGMKVALDFCPTLISLPNSEVVSR